MSRINRKLAGLLTTAMIAAAGITVPATANGAATARSWGCGQPPSPAAGTAGREGRDMCRATNISRSRR
jgi:hypothetical protein